MKAKEKLPKVSLVGAGPGDPELLTVKAINTIRAADLVLYDALVSDIILQMIPAGVPAFSVGKRAGKHSFRQEEINHLMVEFARTYGHVVRLKGGDPFVFGRGHEEATYIRNHGIDVVVVPGISSALAVPASVNIPLTVRGQSESFWVITGTTKEGEMSNDVALAARSTATVVILMGLNQLTSIVQAFKEAGKAGTAVAVVQNGTLPEQRCVVGTIDTIQDIVAIEGIGAPAVIVVGAVAAYATSQALDPLLRQVSAIGQ